MASRARRGEDRQAHYATWTPQGEAPGMPMYSTLDDVVQDLTALEARLRSREDRRCIFVTLYGVVSAEMRDRVALNAFNDPAWVHRYAVTFASLYRRAF